VKGRYASDRISAVDFGTDKQNIVLFGNNNDGDNSKNTN
jgi:hypothetical protein